MSTLKHWRVEFTVVKSMNMNMNSNWEICHANSIDITWYFDT